LNQVLAGRVSRRLVAPIVATVVAAALVVVPAPETRAAPAGSGGSNTWGDFNGDGYGDLAVGAPLESVGAVFAVGAVHVFYGTKSGLTTEGSQFLTQNSSHNGESIDDAAEEFDLFGRSLAAGDFDRDGFYDLAVGVPGENDTGAVHILGGSPTGIKYAGDVLLTQDSELNGVEIQDQAETDDDFGMLLAVGNFGLSRHQDLAIAAPSETLGSNFNAGAVSVIYGSPSGLKGPGNQFWHQDSLESGIAVKDQAEDFDRFGMGLAAGQMGKTQHSDLAIGVEDEDLGTDNEGAVEILYGSDSGLRSKGNQFWHQDSVQGGTRIKDRAEALDNFGQTVIVGDFGGGPPEDLAIGAPLEDVGDPAVAEAGGVAVLYGTSSGIKAGGNQFWTADSPGIADSAETNERFGSSLAAGDFGKTGVADLAIAASREAVAGPSSGQVHVLYGRSNGIRAKGDQVWHQNSSGVEDVAESGDTFGFALSAGDMGRDRRADLGIGVIAESYTSPMADDAGALEVLYGSAVGLTSQNDDFFNQDSPEVPDAVEPSDGFGGGLPGPVSDF
jgi:FG-GAP repeat